MVDYVSQIVGSGVRPFTENFQEIKRISNKKVFAYRLSVDVNSMDLGTLKEAEYLPVTEKRTVGMNFAVRNIVKTVREINQKNARGDDFDFIAVNIPITLAKHTNLIILLSKILKSEKLSNARKLCLEFGADVYIENNENISALLKKLKRLGVSTMFGAYGGEFSPLLRLDGLHFDYIVLTEYFTRMARESRGTIYSSIMTLAKKNGEVIIASGVENIEDSLAVARAGCTAIMEQGF